MTRKFCVALHEVNIPRATLLHFGVLDRIVEALVALDSACHCFSHSLFARMYRFPQSTWSLQAGGCSHSSVPYSIAPMPPICASATHRRFTVARSLARALFPLSDAASPLFQIQLLSRLPRTVIPPISVEVPRQQAQAAPR
jgi:hypothetical protein